LDQPVFSRVGGKTAAEERSDWPSDVQQCGAAADQGRKAAGPSDPTNGSRRSEASNSELRNDNKVFRPQFDDRRE